MPDISSIGHGSFEPLSRPSVASSPIHRNGIAPSEIPGRRETDRVELSDHARFLEKLSTLPEGRPELVELVKQAIHSGSYETEAKLNLAISRLIEEL